MCVPWLYHFICYNINIKQLDWMVALASLRASVEASSSQFNISPQVQHLTQCLNNKCLLFIHKRKVNNVPIYTPLGFMAWSPSSSGCCGGLRCTLHFCWHDCMFSTSHYTIQRTLTRIIRHPRQPGSTTLLL